LSSPRKGEQPRDARIGIRWIVAGAAAALIAAAVLVVSAVTERNTREALSREVEGRLLSMTRNLALAGGDAMLSEFPELTLHPLVREMRMRQPELALVTVVGIDRKVLGDRDPRMLGTMFELDSSLQPTQAREKLDAGELMLSDGHRLVASVPVRHRDGRQIGTAYVGMQLDYLDAVIQAARQQQLVVLLVVLALGAAAALALMSHLLRPVGLLRAGIERIGRGDLGTPVLLRDRTELGLLADAVNDMAAQLRRAQGELVERERLSHELELARQIQSSLLPSRRRVAGPFVIQGSNRAAQEVGGDYFDFFLLPDGRIGLAIADVSGKGLAGCMVMSMLAALLRAYREAASSPARLLATLDERLGETLQPGAFVTMFYGVLDPRRGQLVYASAGHSPLLVYRRATGAIETIRMRGIPLGAMRGGVIKKTLEDRSLEMSPGDVLVQYTDGVNEAFDFSGQEQFGFERLEAVIRSAAPHGAGALLAEVHRAVEEWVGGGAALDDETMLVVAYEGTALAPVGHHDNSIDAQSLLVRARARGRRIEFPAQLDALESLRDWLEQDPAARALEIAEFEVMYTVLHETVANIAEHGFGSDAKRRFEMWTVPAGRAADGVQPAIGQLCFIIRDDGRPFRPEGWSPIDFSDRETWRRGRGIGLDIIFKGTKFVSYQPGTPEGNLTVLAFDPEHLAQTLKERRHA